MITIDELLMAAKEYNASDVHISVGAPPKMRVNGALIDMNYPKLFPEDTSAIITPILTQTQADTLNRKGEIDFSYSIAKAGRYRVNAYKQRGTISAAIRLVGTEIPKPSDLGIPKSVVDLINRQRGLVLVTGPTGSGKSTTLASILDQINETKDKHIITLEDPIEYLHSHKKSMVNQREIGTDSNSYATALRAALREDPDVILVGEMRDLETISIAITAAETGHLVFSTLHTTGAASTIDRVIDVFPPHQQQQIRVQLAMVLECVVSQQLIAKDREKGRIVAFEVMHNTVAIKNLIRENKTYQINSMMQTSKKLGMQTMDDCLYDLYMGGHISAESALNYAQDIQVMTRRLSNGI
jgi:twitching motility protein PilT